MKCNKLEKYPPSMHFAQEDCRSDQRIRAYEAGRVRIGEQDYRRSLLLNAERLIADWRPRRVADLCSEDFAAIFDWRPEILLLGTGNALQFPPQSLTASLLQCGIGVEIMDTAAACRTFNILLSEQRQVAAALLIE